MLRVSTLLSLDDLRVLGVVVDDMLALGPDCDGLLEDSAADVAEVEEPAALGLRMGARRAVNDVDDEAGVTDCRLLMVETLTAALGAMTLDGRVFGTANAGLGRADPGCVVGVGVEGVRVEGNGVGAG